MNRRHFSRTCLGALGASAFSPFTLKASALAETSPGSSDPSALLGAGPSLPQPGNDPPAINASRINQWLAEFSQFGRRADGGVDRIAFSDADLAGRAWVIARMEEAGLDPRVDTAGNILGRRPGTEVGLPPLLMGSHLDSVPAGGNYDGPLGSLGALEVIQTLQEASVRTRHPLELVIFVNEEGGKTGSRVMAGTFQERELALETSSGFTIGEGIRRLGGDPALLSQARRSKGSTAGFLELHIEQGAVLEREGLSIGLVEGIVGIRRWTATVHGSANHAGTTPMNQRRDALLAGARLVEAVNEVVTSIPGSQVATVGKMEAMPGAPNVIPGEVTLTIEIRALTMDRIQEVMDGIEERAVSIGEENGTPITLEEFYLSEAAPSDERFRVWGEEAAQDMGLNHKRMPSGAGHDAQSVAHFAPMGMIFIPSVGGLSHHPEEFSRPEDVAAGVNVLLRTLLKADGGLP